MSFKSFLVVASLAVSVLIGLVLGRSGQGRTPRRSEARTVTIGLSMDTLQEARWARDRDAFVERARELGAEVTVLSANSDDNRQIADVESLITSRVDVIVIVPHDGAAAAKAVRLAHAAGTPVIAYDRLIRDCDLDLYITFDNQHVGHLQAKYLVDQLKARPHPARIVRIYGGKTDNNSFLVKSGQDDALREAIASGAIEVVHEDWADQWKPENAKRIMNAALTRFGDQIDGVLTSNDGTAGGAVQALREEGLAGEILVTGQDAELVACQRIVSGDQSMTVFKPVRTLARRAAEVAVKMALGKPIVARDETHNGKAAVPSIYEEVVTVTKHNLDETIIDSGFHPREAVYRGADARDPTRRP